jgi:hypothetical protein
MNFRLKFPANLLIAALCFSIISTSVAAQSSRVKVLLPVRVDGKWGYVNEKGKVVIKPRFSVAGTFSEGLATVRDNDSWFYYIDIEGARIATNSYFRYADDFSEGLAMVQGESSDEKIGFIDGTGKYVILPRFDSYTGRILWNFSGGLAIVSSNGKLGYIDRSGKFLIEPKFDKASPFSEGLAVVSRDGKSASLIGQAL